MSHRTTCDQVNLVPGTLFGSPLYGVRNGRLLDVFEHHSDRSLNPSPPSGRGYGRRRRFAKEELVVRRMSRYADCPALRRTEAQPDRDRRERWNLGGFSARAVDFVAKPVDRQRGTRTGGRARVHIDARMACGHFSGQSQMRVIIAEDDRVTSHLLCALLRKHGYTPEQALDVPAFVAACEREPGPSAIILDMHMPGGSGTDTLRWLKVHASLGSVPVIVMSGSHSADDDRMARELGAIAFLDKPIQLGLMLEVLQQACAPSDRPS